ncbi:hypothetical protein, partial [Leyella stercorea]|uniref:hypothetical protein n=1 Tax=Leyella stercorea TaxID=363265 RepID=UPI00242ECCBA
GKIWKEKEGVRYGKGGLELQKQRFGSTKATVWHCETSTKVIRVGRYEHPRRSMRMTEVGSMKKKRDGVNEGKERCVPPFFAFATRSDANAICEYL